MKRIGIAASKMSPDNLWIYNLYVVLIASVFSLFLFIIAGIIVVFALIIIYYVSKELVVFDFEINALKTFQLCIAILAGIMGLFNLAAITQNIKLSRD